MSLTQVLTKDDFDAKSKFDYIPDYYDCPVCMSMVIDLYDCPTCKGRACRECLKTYSKDELMKNPDYEAQNAFKCIICHKI